jgi:hypothetical protein
MVAKLHETRRVESHPTRKKVKTKQALVWDSKTIHWSTTSTSPHSLDGVIVIVVTTHQVMSDFDLHLTGSLHPHLVVSARPPSDDCVLHLELVIPDALFPDPDELADLWGSSREVEWSIQPKVVDIERPVRSSAPPVVLSLTARTQERVLDIPLHARYLPPTPEGGHDVVVFGRGGGHVRRAWSCGTGR